MAQDTPGPTDGASAASSASSAALASSKDSVSQESVLPAVAVGVYMRFQVDVIKCEGCAARLKSTLLRQLAGRLQRCAVDFTSGQVLIWGMPGVALTAAEVRSAIQFVDLSYKVTQVEGWGL